MLGGAIGSFCLPIAANRSILLPDEYIRCAPFRSAISTQRIISASLTKAGFAGRPAATTVFGASFLTLPILNNNASSVPVSGSYVSMTSIPATSASFAVVED